MYLTRHLAVPLRRAVQDGAPALVQGPRRSGKTTLLRHEFPDHLYIDLNEAADRAAARRNPEAFLVRLRRPAIIDEVQRAPELVRYLTAAPPALPIVFASCLRLSVSIETLELHPPTRAERRRRPAMPLELLGRFVPAAPKAEHAAMECPPWPRTREFLHRDVPLLISVEDVDRLEHLIALLERRSGELLHQQALARELGVAHRTVVRWLSVLDACFLTLRLEPYDAAFGRRLVRRPKLHVLGSNASFESEVVTEIYCNARHAGLNPVLRYWRDSNGLEVPLIVENDPGLNLVPVAIAPVPNPATRARLQRWMELAGVNEGAIIGREPGLSEHRPGPVLRYALAQL